MQPEEENDLIDLALSAARRPKYVSVRSFACRPRGRFAFVGGRLSCTTRIISGFYVGVHCEDYGVCAELVRVGT